MNLGPLSLRMNSGALPRAAKLWRESWDVAYWKEAWLGDDARLDAELLVQLPDEPDEGANSGSG